MGRVDDEAGTREEKRKGARGRGPPFMLEFFALRHQVAQIVSQLALPCHSMHAGFLFYFKEAGVNNRYASSCQYAI